jgi:hypothetical protein
VKGTWSHRERSIATGHANGGRVKVFSRAEVDALNRSRQLASQEWLDSRPPLTVKLDSIRSLGHLEHQQELRDRPTDFPLSHSRNQYDVNDNSLLRRGPWYLTDDERLQLEECHLETYDFLPQVLEHRARQRDQV